jgi:transposase
MPDRTHGKRSTYVQGCRCLLCRSANDRYEYDRKRGVSYQVDAGPARRCVEELHDAGMFYREIARSTGISRTVIYNLVKAHWRTGRPVTRMSKETYDKIMALADPVRDRHPGKGTLVNSRDFVRCVDALVARGMPVAEIARRTGISCSALYTRHARTKVTAQTAMRMFDGYTRITNGYTAP